MSPILADLSEGVAVFLLFGAVIAVFVLIMVHSVRRQKKLRETWVQFAAERGLHYAGDMRSGMTGSIDQTQIRISREIRGSGKNRSYFTVFETHIAAPLPAGIKLYQENFATNVSKVFGAQDIQIGDGALDNAFMIQGRDTVGIFELLRVPELRAALLQVIGRQPTMMLDGQRLTIAIQNEARTIQLLDTASRDLVYVGGMLEFAARERLAQYGGPTQPAPGRRESPIAHVPEQAPPPLFAAPPVVQQAPAPRYELGDQHFSSYQVTKPDPQPRPTLHRDTMAQVASLFKGLEQKIINGEHVPQPAPHRDDVFDSGTEDPSLKQASVTAFDDPVPPAPVQAPAQAKPPAAGTDFASFIAALADRSGMSSARRDLVKQHADTVWPIEFKVDHVERTFGFSLPEELRDGRTIEGTLDGEVKVQVRVPKADSERFTSLKRGETCALSIKPVEWDDLFRRLTADAV